ncbi:enoyl-CoA hydratase/isomerase family protein [Naumannella sp. ID2617S]|nr:enoyl-CoA hydratase/isomerase family protein [Naumannella sp. ID2617S]
MTEPQGAQFSDAFDSGNEFVRLEVADGIGVLRVDRPKMNPLDLGIQLAIGRCAREAAGRDDVAAVVVTGGEKVFAAGADIKQMLNMGQAEMTAEIDAMHDAFEQLARLPKPTIAAVNGYALGGGLELALVCDVRFAAEDAKLGLPEITLGLVPGLGGTQRLARLVGSARAKDLIFTGRMVGAEEAERIGLVERVLPAGEVQQAALDWARQFVGGPAVALRAAKALVDRGGEVDLVTGLQLEKSWFSALFGTEDRRIGMQAFVDKAKAKFLGR